MQNQLINTALKEERVLTDYQLGKHNFSVNFFEEITVQNWY